MNETKAKKKKGSFKDQTIPSNDKVFRTCQVRGGRVLLKMDLGLLENLHILQVALKFLQLHCLVNRRRDDRFPLSYTLVASKSTFFFPRENRGFCTGVLRVFCRRKSAIKSVPGDIF